MNNELIQGRRADDTEILSASTDCPSETLPASTDSPSETLPASTDSPSETLPASTDSPPETLQTVLQDIELLDVTGKLSNKLVAEKLNELIVRINALSKMPQGNVTEHGRDRGPKSTRTMTEIDAKRIMLGDLIEMSHKDAAAELGLSYGQIYSARFGYTFKAIYKESDKRWATKK